MELQLKRIRKSRGIKQAEMARKLSSLMGKEIKTRTYGSWERQEVTMDLEQAYYCAIALDCTIDEIAGRKVLYTYIDMRKQRMNEAYDCLSDQEKETMSKVVQSYARDTARRIEKDGAEDVQSQSAMGF